jgi:hypothetical protein
MMLLIYYTLISLALDVGAVFLCLAIEQVVPWASMPIFLALYFLILWVSWIFAVRLTAPADETAPRGGASSGQRA